MSRLFLDLASLANTQKRPILPEFKITREPQAFTGLAGSSFTVSVAVSLADAAFELYKNGVLISNQPSFSVVTSTVANTGTYFFKIKDKYRRSLESSKVNVLINPVEEPGGGDNGGGDNGGGDNGGGDNGGGDNGGGETPDNPATTAVFIEGTKMRTNGTNYSYYYDEETPDKIKAVNANEPIIIDNAPNTGIGRVSDIRINENGSGRNIFGVNGFNPSGGQEALNIHYKLSHSDPSGSDIKGTNLSWLGINNYYFDPNSPHNLSKAYGCIIKISYSLSGRNVVGTYYCNESRLEGDVNIMGLVPIAGSPDLERPLYGAKWEIIKQMPRNPAPVNTGFTGNVRGLMMGDSNTGGMSNTGVNLLELAFKTALPNANVSIFNAGVGGTGVADWAPTTDLFKNAVNWCNANGATWVNLNLGTNNRNQTVPYFTDGMRAIINGLKDPSIGVTTPGFKVFVQGIFSPVTHPTTHPRGNIDQFNDAIPSLSDIATIGTFEPGTFFTNNPEHGSDGLHYWAPGYTHVGEEHSKVIISNTIS